MPKVVPMLPATIVPMTPTINETRAPKISRLRTSRPWKSVPRSASGLAPSIQNGGSKILAPGMGSVGSYGTIALANTASSTNGTRIASGNTGNCPANRSQRRLRPSSPGRAPATRTAWFGSVTKAMCHLFGQPDTGIDIGVEDVDHQIDRDDHDAGLHDDPLDERKIALEDALIKKAPGPGPGEDHLDDDRRVEHHDKVDAGQGQHGNEGI